VATMADLREIDFERLELVREAARLTIRDFADFLGVTRAAYYKWLNGGPIRAANTAKIQEALRDLLPLIKEGAWPPKRVRGVSGGDLYRQLLELLESRV